MTAEERKELRKKYCDEYYSLTGLQLMCTEKLIGKRYLNKVAKDYLLDITEAYTAVSKDDITGISRKANIVKVRQWITMILKEVSVKRSEIANMIKCDPSMVTHNVDTITGYIQVDKGYREEYEQYRKYAIDALRKKYDDPHRAKLGKLSKENVKDIRMMKEEGVHTDEICEKYNIHQTSVDRIVSRKTWSHVK